MKTDIKTVDPDMTLPDLERYFLQEKVSGFPVVKSGQLVGIVSRSDIVRQICVERTIAELTSDYFQHPGEPEFHEDLNKMAERIGDRLEHLHVKDVTIHKVFTVSPDQPIEEVASTLLEHRIHRVLVKEGDQLVGIISSNGLVELIADGGLQLVDEGE